jgi:ubiquinone/menaquinone biosynthesis C-methylase UbiE
VNFLHRSLCSSSRWKTTVERYALPWTLEGLDIGDNVLEIGPGYGAATEVLQKSVQQLTCIEVDSGLAKRLQRRMRDENVKVICGDATAMTLEDESFDGAVCFTMLHHVASAELQDRLLAEVYRVLRPNGVFAGTDSLDSRFFRLMHLFDNLVLVDPKAFPHRLRAVGFRDVQVDVNPYALRFRAHKSA